MENICPCLSDQILGPDDVAHGRALSPRRKAVGGEDVPGHLQGQGDNPVNGLAGQLKSARVHLLLLLVKSTQVGL